MASPVPSTSDEKQRRPFKPQLNDSPGDKKHEKKRSLDDGSVYLKYDEAEPPTSSRPRSKFCDTCDKSGHSSKVCRQDKAFFYEKE